MTTSRLFIDQVNAYFRAVNARDWPRLGGLVADAVSVRFPGFSPFEGRDELVLALERNLQPFEHHHDEVVRCHVDGRVAIAELAFSGRTVRGDPVAFDAVEIMEFDGDQRIDRLRLWFDRLDVLQQLQP